jgi:hypothetical protein
MAEAAEAATVEEAGVIIYDLSPISDTRFEFYTYSFTSHYFRACLNWRFAAKFKPDPTFVFRQTVCTLIQQAPPDALSLVPRACRFPTSGGQNVAVAIAVISTYYLTLVTVVLPIKFVYSHSSFSSHDRLGQTRGLPHFSPPLP